MSFIEKNCALQQPIRVAGHPAAGPADDPDRPSLLELWHERNRLIDQLHRVDELADQGRHQALSRAWDELDQRIVDTESRCMQDLRGKIAFMRWWLREPDDSQQHQLMLSIVADIERLVLVPALEAGPDPAAAGRPARDAG